jgi:hypothetical protein
MNDLSVSLLAPVAKQIGSLKERGQLCRLSSTWMEAVRSTLQQVEIDCSDVKQIDWLGEMLKHDPRLLTHIGFRLPGILQHIPATQVSRCCNSL